MSDDELLDRLFAGPPIEPSPDMPRAWHDKDTDTLQVLFNDGPYAAVPIDQYLVVLVDDQEHITGLRLCQVRQLREHCGHCAAGGDNDRHLDLIKLLLNTYDLENKATTRADRQSLYFDVARCLARFPSFHLGEVLA